jgi:hypothetical protein
LVHGVSDGACHGNFRAAQRLRRAGHDVTLPSGETVYNPLRVIRDGDGCEVVFTIRQRPEMTDKDFKRDADAVAKDLARLKSVVEAK